MRGAGVALGFFFFCINFYYTACSITMEWYYMHWCLLVHIVFYFLPILFTVWPLIYQFLIIHYTLSSVMLFVNSLKNLYNFIVSVSLFTGQFSDCVPATFSLSLSCCRSLQLNSVWSTDWSPSLQEHIGLSIILCLYRYTGWGIKISHILKRYEKWKKLSRRKLCIFLKST